VRWDYFVLILSLLLLLIWTPLILVSVLFLKNNCSQLAVPSYTMATKGLPSPHHAAPNLCWYGSNNCEFVFGNIVFSFVIKWNTHTTIIISVTNHESWLRAVTLGCIRLAGNQDRPHNHRQVNNDDFAWQRRPGNGQRAGQHPGERRAVSPEPHHRLILFDLQFPLHAIGGWR